VEALPVYIEIFIYLYYQITRES